MQEEHTTRIQIKIDDSEAQASIERLVNELKKAQDIAQNLLVGGIGIGGGAGAITGAARVAGASGAVNGGGTTTTAGGGGGGEGLPVGGLDRDAVGTSAAATNISRARRHARAVAGIAQMGISGISGGAGAGAAILSTGLNVLQSTFRDLSNQPAFGVAGALLGATAAGANMRVSQFGAYGQGQTQRNQMYNMMGFDPGIAGAFRKAGTQYDADQYGRPTVHTGPGRAGAWGSPGYAGRAYPGMGSRPWLDPTQMGFSSQAAMGILGGSARAYGHESYAESLQGSAYTNPFVMTNRGASPQGFAALAGRGFVARDIEQRFPTGLLRSHGLAGGGGAKLRQDIGPLAAQTLAHGERNLGLTGSGIDQFMGRVGALGGIPGAMGGAMDLEGLNRVLLTGAGKGAGMQALTFAQKAMGGGMGAYQNTLGMFGNMPELLSMAYAAREGKGGIEGFLAAQEQFGSNPRLAAKEAQNVFGKGSTGAKIAYRQMGVGTRNINAFANEDWSVGKTTPAFGSLDAIAQDQVVGDQSRLSIARANAQAGVDTQRHAIGGDERGAVGLVDAVTTLNQSMIDLGAAITPLTVSMGNVVRYLRNIPRWMIPW